MGREMEKTRKGRNRTGEWAKGRKRERKRKIVETNIRREKIRYIKLSTTSRVGRRKE